MMPLAAVVDKPRRLSRSVQTAFRSQKGAEYEDDYDFGTNTIVDWRFGTMEH
jgi:hypothetical protein